MAFCLASILTFYLAFFPAYILTSLLAFHLASFQLWHPILTFYLFGSRRAPQHHQHPGLAIWSSGPCALHSLLSWRYGVRVQVCSTASRAGDMVIGSGEKEGGAGVRRGVSEWRTCTCVKIYIETFTWQVGNKCLHGSCLYSWTVHIWSHVSRLNRCWNYL